MIRTFVLNISMLSTELDLLKSQKLSERLDLYVEKVQCTHIDCRMISELFQTH